MTKQQALQQFSQHIKPSVVEQYKSDGKEMLALAMSLSWTTYTLRLWRSGRITSNQLTTWANPFTFEQP